MSVKKIDDEDVGSALRMKRPPTSNVWKEEELSLVLTPQLAAVDIAMLPSQQQVCLKCPCHTEIKRNMAPAESFH